MLRVQFFCALHSFGSGKFFCPEQMSRRRWTPCLQHGVMSMKFQRQTLDHFEMELGHEKWLIYFAQLYTLTDLSVLKCFFCMCSLRLQCLSLLNDTVDLRASAGTHESKARLSLLSYAVLNTHACKAGPHGFWNPSRGLLQKTTSDLIPHTCPVTQSHFTTSHSLRHHDHHPGCAAWFLSKWIRTKHRSQTHESCPLPREYCCCP